MYHEVMKCERKCLLELVCHGHIIIIIIIDKKALVSQEIIFMCR